MSKSPLQDQYDAAKARHAKLASEVSDLAERAERGEITPEQLERLERQTSALNRVNGEVEALEQARKEEVRAIASDHPDWAEGGVDDTYQLMRRVKAWDEPLNLRRHSPDQIRDAALAANDAVTGDTIDSYDRERIEKLLRRDKNGQDGIYISAVSNPDYRGAFTKYLQHGDGAALFFTEDERKAMAYAMEVRGMTEASNSAGAALVPFALDPTIVLTNTGVFPGSVRNIARVETVNSSVGHYVTSAGVTAEWVSEAGESTDASPTFTQVSITPIRADAYVQASYELVQDSNVEEQLGRVIADAKMRLEETAFATGTGTTQPFGIVTRLAATTASRVAAQTNASFGAVDVYALDNALPARHQPNASWLGPKFIYNMARQFGGPQTPNFWVDFAPGLPSTMLGHPTYLSAAITNAAGGTTSLSAATASNDDILVIGDFQNFVIVDRIGMSITVNPVVIGTNRRPTGEMGFFAFWRCGSDSLNSDAFRLLRV